MPRTPTQSCPTCGQTMKVAYVRMSGRTANGYEPVGHWCLNCASLQARSRYGGHQELHARPDLGRLLALTATLLEAARTIHDLVAPWVDKSIPNPASDVAADIAGAHANIVAALDDPPPPGPRIIDARHPTPQAARRKLERPQQPSLGGPIDSLTTVRDELEQLPPETRLDIIRSEQRQKRRSRLQAHNERQRKL